jgi:hypothetical protein
LFVSVKCICQFPLGLIGPWLLAELVLAGTSATAGSDRDPYNKDDRYQQISAKLCVINSRSIPLIFDP